MGAAAAVLTPELNRVPAKLVSSLMKPAPQQPLRLQGTVRDWLALLEKAADIPDDAELDPKASASEWELGLHDLRATLFLIEGPRGQWMKGLCKRATPRLLKRYAALEKRALDRLRRLYDEIENRIDVMLSREALEEQGGEPARPFSDVCRELAIE